MWWTITNMSLLKSALFWVTLMVVALCVWGSLIDMRYKLWLGIIVFAVVVLLPCVVFDALKGKRFANAAKCLVLVAGSLVGVVAWGWHINEKAEPKARLLLAEIAVFQAREARPPTLSEVKRLMHDDSTSERLTDLAPGIRVSYEIFSDQKPCLRLFHFPGSWRRMCVGAERDVFFRDEL